MKVHWSAVMVTVECHPLSAYTSATEHYHEETLAAVSRSVCCSVCLASGALRLLTDVGAIRRLYLRLSFGMEILGHHRGNCPGARHCFSSTQEPSQGLDKRTVRAPYVDCGWVVCRRGLRFAHRRHGKILVYILLTLVIVAAVAIPATVGIHPFIGPPNAQAPTGHTSEHR
jgi:hypothetical protein